MLLFSQNFDSLLTLSLSSSSSSSSEMRKASLWSNSSTNLTLLPPSSNELFPKTPTQVKVGDDEDDEERRDRNSLGKIIWRQKKLLKSCAPIISNCSEKEAACPTKSTLKISEFFWPNKGAANSAFKSPNSAFKSPNSASCWGFYSDKSSREGPKSSWALNSD